MSRHICETSTRKYVFGWDQPLMSFYLQVHDTTLPEDDNPVVWLGSSGDSIMYEVVDLVRTAKKHGLDIGILTQSSLFFEKDVGG